METVLVEDLPSSWLLPHPNRPLMELGRRWALEKGSLLMKVPSALVRGEGWNYLANPLHPEFHLFAIVDALPFEYDGRLLGRV